MKTKSSTVSTLLAWLVLVLIGLIAAPPAHAAGEDWTCSGVQSALCTTTLTADRCANADRVCFSNGDDNLFNQKNCACAPACDTSADCGSSAACHKGHCWSNLSCNTASDCPADARCFDGSCRKLGACSTGNDCNASAPDCIDGSCGTLLPGQCNGDADCGGDPCGGRFRCDAGAHRCVRSGPLPCAGIAHARCFATSPADVRCYVPACTSDAQCTGNACEGAQRCDLPTGRCIPAQPACNEAAGEICEALSATAFQCLMTAPHPPWGQIDNSPTITQPDLTLIPEVGTPGGPGSGRFVLTGTLPSSALAKGAPSAVAVILATADREVLVDGRVDASDKVGAWTFDAKSDAWRWEAKDRAARIDHVVIERSGDNRAELRFEIAGRTIARSGKPGSAGAQYGAEVLLQGAGPDAKPVRSAIVFAECKDGSRKGAMTTDCAGKAAR